MNVNMDFRKPAGSSSDRNVVSGGFRELDNDDQGRLKHNAGVIARTGMEVT